MKIYLVRHGQSEANKNNTTQGQIDSPLTEKGIEQAKAIANRLKLENIDLAYSSDLQRASKTAEEILKFHPKIRLNKIKELREMSKGKYEGMKHKHFYDELEKQNLLYCHFRPEGGENYSDRLPEIAKFYNTLPDKNILIVAHGGSIICSILHLLNVPIEEYRKYLSNNTSLTVINNKQIKILNCTEHLSKTL
ncbi:histidine phosphatase family protein [archaeon]|jgi:phosphoserine phosphatase|nr:histidine phosphatase family protein [archaeon]MBT3730406.1 histidine phosphatase family protein [archaeon]MBT4670389.1 histidine phosphatase family protein [archaeon]MBT5030146.1 histidine phosphatase family protein [archaeon]MBT5288163.1 histidine phosphatase family protein [archaeon]